MSDQQRALDSVGMMALVLPRSRTDRSHAVADEVVPVVRNSYCEHLGHDCTRLARNDRNLRHRNYSSGHRRPGVDRWEEPVDGNHHLRRRVAADDSHHVHRVLAELEVCNRSSAIDLLRHHRCRRHD